MEELLPDQLKNLWKEVDANRLSAEDFHAEEERLTDVYRSIWADALKLDGHADLTSSLLAETGLYVGCDDLAEVERRCRQGVHAVKEEWETTFLAEDEKTIEKFYDASQAYVYDLMWWHSLAHDLSPLAYVLALQFAMGHGCRSHLDFGSGAGAGSILFGRHGFEITLADISSNLLDFCRWRLELRKMPARFLDLKTESLPVAAYDFITAMDVFEHLVDPVAAVDGIAASLKPGGFLMGRFEPAADAKHPQHIVLDFGPTFDRLNELGLVEAWRDEWLWGHRVFRKS